MSRSGGAARLAPLVGVLVVALAARLAFVLASPLVIAFPDGRQYEQVALSLVEHGTYGEQTLRPPGYPTVIAAVYAVAGRNLLALRVVEALLGTLVVGLIGVVGARLWGERAGLIAAILAALHPVLAFLPSTQYSETVLLLALVPGFGLALVAAREGGAWRWAAAGLAFGLATLVRPNAVLLLPGLALGLAAAMTRERRPWLAGAAVFAVALALTVTPWIVRNHAVHGRWFFVATGGGRSLLWGNHDRATAKSNSLIAPDSALIRAAFALPHEVDRDRYFYAQGLRFMREHPGRAAQLYLVKLGNLFALYPETLTRSRYMNAWSRATQGLASVIVFAGALLALTRWRREPSVWPLALACASFALGNALFFSVMRYRMSMEPCLLWMAGLGWSLALASYLDTRTARARRTASDPVVGGTR